MRMNLGRFLFRIAASCRSEPPGLSQNNVKADLVNPVNSFPFPKLNHSEESMGNLSRSKTFSKICKFWSIVIILVVIVLWGLLDKMDHDGAKMTISLHTSVDS